jgi:hypothetical protein
MQRVIDCVVVGLQSVLALERVVFPLSPDTIAICQYVILTHCHLSLPLIYLRLWAMVVIVGKE